MSHKDDNTKGIQRATVKEMAHKIKGYNSPRFAFFLGAGASRQSGIPVAGEMIRHFKEQIISQSCPDGLKTDGEKKEWLEKQEWYAAEGSEYCKCFERFEPKEMGRQRYIESLIEGREPSFGYVVLANLLAGGHINTIITTNFDDLVYSACTTFTGIRPIVYAYGVMASEMRITALRPKILKLHGDYLYSALKNTGTELSAQDPNMARQARQVLSEYGLIVVGYGGGDKTVMDIFSDISDRNDLYWCARRGEQLNDRVVKLLQDKRGFLVEIEGFDEMMNEVRRVVGFDVRKMVGSIEDRRNQIIDLFKKFDPEFSAEILGEVAEAVKEPTTNDNKDAKADALTLFVMAYQAEKANDLGKAEELYRGAIGHDPNYTFAYNNLGIVLRNLKRYEEAEVTLRKAIEIDPSDAVAHSNLGNALRDLKRYEEAEAALRKAIEIDPNYAIAHGNLGNVLKDLKRDGEAEAAYRKAVELNPNNAVTHSNLGNVLKDLKRYEEAEVALRKAIGIDLNYGGAYYNLACLESVRGNVDAALNNLWRAAQLPGFDSDWARRDPDFEAVRDDPRFEEIIGGATE